MWFWPCCCKIAEIRKGNNLNSVPPGFFFFNSLYKIDLYHLGLNLIGGENALAYKLMHP